MNKTTVVRPGRNEPCRCGSGRKYKQCCLDKDESEARIAHAKAAAEAPESSPDAAPGVSAGTETHDTAALEGLPYARRSPARADASQGRRKLRSANDVGA